VRRLPKKGAILNHYYLSEEKLALSVICASLPFVFPYMPLTILQSKTMAVTESEMLSVK
jgi:hypothetical protein